MTGCKSLLKADPGLTNAPGSDTPPGCWQLGRELCFGLGVFGVGLLLGAFLEGVSCFFGLSDCQAEFAEGDAQHQPGQRALSHFSG